MNKFTFNQINKLFDININNKHTLRRFMYNLKFILLIQLGINGIKKFTFINSLK